MQCDLLCSLPAQYRNDADVQKKYLTDICSAQTLPVLILVSSDSTDGGAISTDGTGSLIADGIGGFTDFCPEFVFW